MITLADALDDLATQLIAEDNPAGERLLALLHREDARRYVGKALDRFSRFLATLSDPTTDRDMKIARLYHEDWRHMLRRAESHLMDDALRAELRADREAAA